MAIGILYNQLKGGEILYKSTSDKLICFISGETISTPDIYYGKVSGGTTFMPSAAYIKANFNTASGDVGGYYPTPRQYTLDTTLGKYLYICSKDLPSGSTYGYRAINLVRNTTNESVISKISPIANSVYKYQQLVPPTTTVPPYLLKQDTYFGKIDIDGITYRVWKSGGVNSDLNIYVYSI